MDQRYNGSDTVTKSDEDAMDLLPVTAGEVQDFQDKAEESNLDAEGEDDDADANADVIPEVHADSDPDADIDAEGEEDDEEPILPIRRALKVAEQEDGDEDAEVETASEAHPESESGRDSDTNTDTEVENEWEAESDTAAEVEAEIVDPNQCIFCGGDEEHDPSEEFEEYLACAVCGDNSHRQCARDANSLGPDDDAEHWRCKTCVTNGLQADANESREKSRSRRRSSAPKLTKELLPGGRGTIKPDSHSVFAKLIVDGDPMDGSRSLRKRKPSNEDEPEQHPRLSRKRRRPSEALPTSTGRPSASATTSPRATRAAMSEEAVVNGDHAVTSGDEGSPKLRTRSRRAGRNPDKGLCHLVTSEGISVIVSFNLDPAKMQKILASRPRKGRARDRSRKKIIPPVIPEPEISHYPAIPSGFASQLLAMADREQDESKMKPYGGILSEIEANSEKTFPQEADRKRFEDARLKAEEDWRKKMAADNALQEVARSTQKTSGPPSKIKCIAFGNYQIDTWNAAPYPEEYSRNRLLYICEYCLKYMNSDFVAFRHKLKCPAKHPPGDEIYRDGKYSFYEVDGRKNPVYCQNLCLLAKLFLGSKTLYYDVEPFLFYVMTEEDEFGCHFVGYFSKEKRPSSMNNVSCILVLPIFQRRGFGHMLIDFSYLLTKNEQKMGSPEKPLSDMGLVSYRGYWRLTLCELLRKHKGTISISRISELTGMTPDDIVSALEGLRALVRDPVTKTYALRIDHAYFNEYVEKHEKKGYPKIDPEALIWTPYVMNRGLTSHYEEGGPLHAVAPREEEEEDAATPLDEEGSKKGDKDKERMVNGHGGKPTNGITIPKDATDDTPRASSQPRRAGSQTRAASRTRAASQTRDSGSPRPHPSTPPPLQNGYSHLSTWSVTSHPSSNLSIPPHRFEIFPPVPGMNNRRRPGRPFGSRTRSSRNPNGTPSRRTISSHQMSRTVGAIPRQRSRGFGGNELFRTGSPRSVEGLRRTRSMLGEELVGGGADVVNGGGVNGDDHEGDEDAQGEEDADADAEGEEDADIDADVDAEGEDDLNADADADGEEEDIDADADADADIDAEGEIDDAMDEG
ncbi:hypothetical protein FKW77_006105 [Venturia effusa]|uniref:Histone acetyltransferase n=1 Tax=Venturia effusa TaxID=50376 RepID=A0A517LHC3_9PEZI|nr:hypothetical protein FKW77_006105 [Venturia effusa]